MNNTYYKYFKTVCKHKWIVFKATSGIVKIKRVHRIGDDYYSHCLPFPDPDYRSDVEGITGKPLVIHPVKKNMTDEELREEIRKSLKITMSILKNAEIL